MWRWHRVLTITVGSALLGAFSGCGGGQSVTNSAGLEKPNNPPVATLLGYAPADAPLVRYKVYTFQASASDPDIGDSITKYEWDFGDGSDLVQTTAPSVSHLYANVAGGGSQVIPKVRAYDNHNQAGGYSSRTLSLDSSASPITVTFKLPTGPVSVQADPSGGVQVTFQVQVSSAAPGAISLSGITFNPGDSKATVTSQTDLGNGLYSFLVRYLGDAVPGVRIASPTILVKDSGGVPSEITSGPQITVTTLALANHAPVIAVTEPVTPTAQGYTSKPVTLGFTITDEDGDVVGYTVNWGDGTPITESSTSGDTKAGVAVTLTHGFPDTFTSTSRNSTVVINATDGRSNNGTAVSQSRTFTISFNSFPTASITSPQASANLPSPAELPSNPSIGLVNPPGANDPDILVIPSGGKLKFNGTATLPGSQDAIQAYAWTFQGGTPAVSSFLTPESEIQFPVTPGAITPYLVEFKVIDALGRSSSQAPGVNPKTFRKWIVVDGKNTQLFKLNFMYRQISDNNGIATLTPIALGSNGLGANIRIFQDGVTNTYAVKDPAATKAQVAIPVRSDLPFYALLPNYNNSVDNRSYLMRIPNAPTGASADPALGVTLNANTSSFGFENTSAPWNPTLQVVTAQGFAAETAPSPERRLLGTVSFVWGNSPPNSRYFDRLSIPLDGTDSFGAIDGAWVWNNNFVYTINGARAQQSIAEWVFEVGNRSTSDTPSTAGGPPQMQFTVNYPKYTGDSQQSETFAHERMQVFRVPPGVTDPYNLDVGGWQNSNLNISLNPTVLPGTFNGFISNAVYGGFGSAAFSGGLQGIPIPYDANDPNRSPYAPARTYDLFPTRSVLGYAEYLWSSVWARPLILNVANPNFMDSWTGLASFGYFRKSSPAAWPAVSGIVPDLSAFNMNVTGAGTFNASSPVAIGGATPGNKGVGRFYWTAFTPFYNAAVDSMISRTWLSEDATGLPPMAITGSTGDSRNAFGFLPPQDTVVDKRGRNADGSLNGSNLGGYRVTWFNPTKDPAGNPVPPDFWVVEFETPSGTFHYLLPSNFPSGTQQVGDLVLTDARTYLPSGRTAAQGPIAGNTDKVAPGYCWFDVPPELRPSLQSPDATSYLRVFGLKSILKNSPPAGARALNRPDWIDAIKTALPEISVQTLGGDISYAHKIPFNFYWDIVVVNGPRTPVAP